MPPNASLWQEGQRHPGGKKESERRGSEESAKKHPSLRVTGSPIHFADGFAMLHTRINHNPRFMEALIPYRYQPC